MRPENGGRAFDVEDLIGVLAAITDSFTDSGRPSVKKAPKTGAKIMAPEEGLEPSTTRLTAACSTIELLWNPKWTRNLLIAARRVNDFGRRRGLATPLNLIPAAPAVA